MIFGIGTDIIEVERIRKTIDQNKNIKKKLFTDKEIQYCEAKNTFAESFSARFSAKEALFKALGTGWRNGFQFTEVEVITNKLGKPEIVLHGKTKEYVGKLGITKIHLSLSHQKNYATAFVVLEK